MPSASILSRRSSAAARRSAAMPVAGLPTTTALVRSGYRAAKCSAIAPPTAMPASATLPDIAKLSSSAAISSAIVSRVISPRTFCDNPAPRLS